MASFYLAQEWKDITEQFTRLGWNELIPTCEAQTARREGNDEPQHNMTNMSQTTAEGKQVYELEQVGTYY